VAVELEDIIGRSGGTGVTRLTATRPDRSDSGGSGIFGKVARGVLAPLTLLDTGRRGIISGAREIVDALDDDPNTRFSFTDFREQTADPTYGFGTAFPDITGTKWGDRLIGFVGDVALDPITYLGFGAGKAATMAGRAAYSTNLLRAARATNRIEEATPIIQKVSSGGVNSLRAGERALFDDIIRAGRNAGIDAGSEIGTSGLRFRVPFTNIESAVIPGTRTGAGAVARGLAGTRRSIGQSRVGTAARSRIAPREQVDLYNTMVRGSDPETLFRGLMDNSARIRETGAERITANRLLQEADDITKTGRKEGVSGEQVSREISSGNPASTVARRIRDFLRREGEELREDLPGFDLRETAEGTYLPRVVTDEGRTAVRGEFGDELNATLGFVDELGAESIIRSRQINKGDKLFRGEKFEVLEGNDPFSFNKAMNKLYPELGDIKFVETDGYKLMEKWARSAAAAKGRRAYADELMAFGVAQPERAVRREQSLARQFADQADSRATAQRAENIVEGRRAALERSEQNLARADETLARRAGRFADADEARAAEMQARAGRREGEIYDRMQRQIDEADRQMQALDERAASIDPSVATPEEVNFLQQSLARTRQQLENAKFDVGDAATDEVVGGLVSEMGRLNAEADRFLQSAGALRRSPRSVSDPRVAGSQRVRQRAVEARDEARRKLDEAEEEGFLASLNVDRSQSRLLEDVQKLPDKGNRRFKREVRALTEDVPESELLTRDERYLAGLRARALGGDEYAMRAHALMMDAFALEARIAVEGGDARRFANFFETLGKNTKNSADFRENILNQLERGWRQIEGTGIAVPDEVYAMRTRLVTLREPQVFNGFLKAWEGYTRIFKAYVTATPRFHIRNGLSAAFMNFSDGVTSADMLEGVRIWRKYSSSGINALDQTERTVIESVLGSGAGQYDALELGYRAPRGTKWSRRAGRNVEGAVRAGAAVATVRQGGSLQEAVARITRLHFDYSQFSNFDRVARQVFPFWTFMSRNLPLQVTQMWTKPKSYQRFNTVIRNIRTDDEETGEVPDYFLEGGGFRLPGLLRWAGRGDYARPDLGFSRVEEDAERLGDPIGFLADANPVIKGLVEGFADKQLYKDIPLDDESYVPLSGWQQILAPVLLAIGQAERQRDGDVVVTPKTEYLIDQFVPVGSLFNRYAGEGSRNEGNAFRNIYSAIGVPSFVSGGGYVRELTPEIQASSRRRREFEQAEAMRKLREIANASSN